MGDGRARKSRWSPDHRKQFEAAHEDGEQVEDRAAESVHKPTLPLCKTQTSPQTAEAVGSSLPQQSVSRPQTPKPGRSRERPSATSTGGSGPQQPRVPRSQGQQTFLKGWPGMRVLNLQFHSDLVTNQQQGHVTPTGSQQSGGPPAS